MNLYDTWFRFIGFHANYSGYDVGVMEYDIGRYRFLYTYTYMHSCICAYVYENSSIRTIFPSKHTYLIDTSVYVPL